MAWLCRRCGVTGGLGNVTQTVAGCFDCIHQCDRCVDGRPSECLTPHYNEDRSLRFSCTGVPLVPLVVERAGKCQACGAPATHLVGRIRSDDPPLEVRGTQLSRDPATQQGEWAVLCRDCLGKVLDG